MPATTGRLGPTNIGVTKGVATQAFQFQFANGLPAAGVRTASVDAAGAAATGDRPLGLQAAQLISVERWLGEHAGVQKVRLESAGPRSQVAALVAATLETARGKAK
ncbi:MAG: hypothetical protein ACE15B_25225 [Bryobacteraceae bacterium]